MVERWWSERMTDFCGDSTGGDGERINRQSLCEALWLRKRRKKSVENARGAV